jgi:hypothetical protein
MGDHMYIKFQEAMLSMILQYMHEEYDKINDILTQMSTTILTQNAQKNA